MVQALSKLTNTKQNFTYSAITWEEFKTIQNVLAPRGVKVSYFQGEDQGLCRR